MSAPTLGHFPDWVPAGAKLYLAHTETGTPIRALARMVGCHASTVLRQIRRVETRRDDPLIDAALRTLGTQHLGTAQRKIACQSERDMDMRSEQNTIDMTPDEASLTRDAMRILRRLCEKGSVLAVAKDMEKAVVVRDDAHGATTRTAVVDCAVAQAMALKDWISAASTGRITRYQITAAGRVALNEMLATHQKTKGFNEAPAEFSDAQRTWGEKVLPDTETGRPKRMRYNLGESPLTALARRRDKDGSAFLSDDQVRAGERLREDFELAQMGPRVAQNWDRFLTGGGRGGFVGDSGVGDGPSGARGRVADAMADLGPGLSDVVLRCCCFLEGLETAEKKLGWSARSGKIVLRIALTRLQRHYEESTGPGGGMIG
ncbi:DUF6456 domain-containing protein [Pseudosulfitobacter sp. SM2401]|uniref:DUF6456 domain-containing protein n=1 Tax=Pseudosulfitobacter sp. SM2401 TaxID=3350098 RepID=UPI0036F3DA28